MRKNLILSVFLILIDQVTKLLISKFFLKVHTTLIPNVLNFHPVKNTNLNWISSIVDYHTSVLQMIIVQILALVISILVYRYLAYISDPSGKERFFTNGFLAVFIVGILCSFLDVVIWGGSLDFVRLFNWFTFDLKDVYLSVATIFLILFLILYMNRYYKLSKHERKQMRAQQSILKWIKFEKRKNCPKLKKSTKNKAL